MGEIRNEKCKKPQLSLFPPTHTHLPKPGGGTSGEEAGGFCKAEGKTCLLEHTEPSAGRKRWDASCARGAGLGTALCHGDGLTSAAGGHPFASIPQMHLQWAQGGQLGDAPDVPACCASRTSRPRGHQGGIWVPRGSASPMGGLLPVVPRCRQGCGASGLGGCVTPGRVAREGCAAAAEPSAPPVYK